MSSRLLLSLGFAARLLAAEGPAGASLEPAGAGIYHADPKHLWNRLQAAFYQREVETAYDKPRHRMGPEVLDPPLGVHPRYLLEEEPFARCNAVLDEFLAAPGEMAAVDPLKRALLQRDLWAVFDLLQAETEDGLRNFGDTPEFAKEHQEHRAILSRKVARCVKLLALPRAQLEALPATYALAVKANAFPAAAGSQAKGDYLPADLFAEKSPWVEATTGGKPFLHTQVVDGRSVFRVFYRPPTDADGGVKFAAWVAEQKRVFATEDDPSGRKWNGWIQSVPLGTQFLLLREMVSIDDRGELVPTHVVETVQVRVYRTAPPALPSGEAGPPDHPSANQLFEEFKLDRGRLFRGEAGGLKSTPQGAPRLMGYAALGRLATNKAGLALPPDPFPQNCLVCHMNFEKREGQPKLPLLLLSHEQAAKLQPPPWGDEAAQTTLKWKAKQKDFLRLRELGKP